MIYLTKMPTILKMWEYRDTIKVKWCSLSLGLLMILLSLATHSLSLHLKTKTNKLEKVLKLTLISCFPLRSRLTRPRVQKEVL